MSLQQYERGDLVTKVIEENQVLNAFFKLVFTDKASLQKSQVPVARRKVWNKEDLLFLQEDDLGEHLNKFYL